MFRNSVGKILQFKLIEKDIIHTHKTFTRLLSVIFAIEIRISYHILSLFGLASIFWSGHIKYYIIPIEAFITDYNNQETINLQHDINNHVFRLNIKLGKFYLTF